MATPRQRYIQQRSNARRRGVLFDLTYKEWWDVREKSGCYHARGRNGYVMAQIQDGNGFVAGNVEIIPAAQVFRQAMDAYYGGERDYTP